MKQLISVLIALLASSVCLFGQDWSWTVDQLEEQMEREQWDPLGNGVMWLGYYRSFTYYSEDNKTVDVVFVIKDHKTRVEAKDDFAVVKFFYRQGCIDEWEISKRKSLIVFENYCVYLSKKGKRVSIEYSPGIE